MEVLKSIKYGNTEYLLLIYQIKMIMKLNFQKKMFLLKMKLIIMVGNTEYGFVNVFKCIKKNRNSVYI
ncbi:hypothetical protein IMG5_150260 [Ichthyophthirius multifiliis]|uniref:Uncharacterized protein n=1 Tax=Ichthyophthirius multifiliis TaxID=5932 RepID=G0QYK1_ICHMU|nr:hypothetical protein IMG5_150260 [Ichthyophthirius multifiliis]EGR29708.1 hypothetical protein IMG5_150260 [Ichthyophthirius multifiliis]|eukprot:XP_004030944.1 hypothetical protein IMG5_150260 [Ichthyophthirius multifiliis]